VLCAYHAPFADFRRDCAGGLIGPLVEKGFSNHFGYMASPSEAASWAASLIAVTEALGESAIQSYVFLELQMPLSSARCDLLLIGRNRAGQAVALIVELKQWSHVSESAVRDTVAVMGRPVVHPSIQSRSYVNYLKHFHGGCTGTAGLIPRGCAFLPNLKAQRDIRILTSSDVFGTIPREFPVFPVHLSQNSPNTSLRRLAKVLSKVPRTSFSMQRFALQSGFWTLWRRRCKERKSGSS